LVVDTSGLIKKGEEEEAQAEEAQAEAEEVEENNN